MRMWMVDPKTMCQKHLLGEHGELHKFLHNWKKKHRIDARIAKNQMEPSSYKKRHDALAEEMLRRGMNHKSPLAQPDFSYLPEEQEKYRVDTESSLWDLHQRCADCAQRSQNERL